ncbi:MAG: type VI secretion system tip protein VgrG, partial [Candidatus Methylumidiphilus alinenensis]
MAISQKNRSIQLATPLGEDVLLFYRMRGTEKLGELFEYEIDMLSENAAIDQDKMLGENVTVGIKLPEGGWRYLNGYVARFGQYELINGFAAYRATLRPWLWFLTRAANCRIFQNLNVPAIVKQVFSDQG